MILSQMTLDLGVYVPPGWEILASKPLAGFGVVNCPAFTVIAWRTADGYLIKHERAKLPTSLTDEQKNQAEGWRRQIYYATKKSEYPNNAENVSDIKMYCDQGLFTEDELVEVIKWLRWEVYRMRDYHYKL